MFGLETGAFIVLLVCLLFVCAFEFINGFHDTANAVATVIYTNSMPPQTAVVYSGILNFLGVFLGGITVAMGIATLLPIEAVMHPNVNVSLALILSILLSAIIWNFGTWYYGIPASSSHTLIGSILGATMSFSLYQHSDMSLVKWEKATEIGLSLLISPLLGFGVALILMQLLIRFYPSKALFDIPHPTDAPPLWVRSMLIFTCGSVSFWHGSNDGQKGVGLLMVILIALVPMHFALNAELDLATLKQANTEMEGIFNRVRMETLESEARNRVDGVKYDVSQIKLLIANKEKMQDLSREDKIKLRKHLAYATKQMLKIKNKHPKHIEKADFPQFVKSYEAMNNFIAYAPSWAILLISLSLGIGTMVGWKRIVLTIGEKIGKEHLNYAQGVTSQFVATFMIALSTRFGMPVSTTHVLSSGIAGTMVAGKGVQNLQGGTIRSIALAWVLTLPVCIALSMLIFGIGTLFF
ncbi:MAG: anion permease [Bacteroidetes bacterium]|nr:MAG: anion permease [Bacteroidota bacterium]